MKILVPFDGSIESREAAFQAVAMAKKDGSSITLLTVIAQDCNPSFSDTVNTKEYISLQGETLRIKITNAEKILDEFVESLQCPEITIDQRIAVGFPHSKIVSTAKAGNYDLVITGHRERNVFKRLFLSSSIKKVLVHAPCSVLVVK